MAFAVCIPAQYDQLKSDYQSFVDVVFVGWYVVCILVAACLRLLGGAAKLKLTAQHESYCHFLVT